MSDRDALIDLAEEMVNRINRLEAIVKRLEHTILLLERVNEEELSEYFEEREFDELRDNLEAD